MNTPQHQRAGNDSNQLQILGDVVFNQGVTEETASKIALAVAREVVEGYFAEGRDVAHARIDELEKKLIPLLSVEGHLDAFRDPAFQVVLREAQVGAASTDRDEDYEMLAGLLNDHAQRGDVRTVRAGLRRAIEVVDQLDADALRALTVHSALTQYSPSSASIRAGFAVMEDLYLELVGNLPLPDGDEWVDHLDVLDAVRINTATSFIPYRDYLSKLLPGYITTGLQDGSDELNIAMTRLRSENVLIEPVAHELKPGYVRFPAASINTFRGDVEKVLGLASSARVIEIIGSDFKLNEPDPTAADALMVMLEECPHFFAAVNWWDRARPYFHVTAIGRVLARANAARLYSGELPPIN